MIFEAIVKEVKIKESVSNDREVLIKLETSDIVAVELQKFIARDTVKVEIHE